MPSSGPFSFTWANASASVANRLVSISAAGTVDYHATDTTPADGVTDQEGVAQNGTISIDTMFGRVRMFEAGAAVSAGALLMATTGGKVITATTGKVLVGRAIEAASGDTKLFLGIFYGGRTLAA